METVTLCDKNKWVSARSISKLLGKRNGWAKKVIGDTMAVNFQQFYPPCVMIVLHWMIDIVPRVPEGWLTRNQIIKLCKRPLNWRTAQAELNPYMGESVIMRDSHNRKFRYFPPEVVKIICGE